MSGKLRNEIMEKCPDGFKDELKSFIDDIEHIVGSIRDTMQISDISDIGNVDTAHDMISELADDLY